MKRRLLSAFLAVMMVLTMAPVAFAADENTVETSEYVAQVGDSGYTTLAEALSEWAANGGTLKLLQDGELTAKVTLNKVCTLDLNGQKLSTGVSQALYVNGGTLTIEDSSEDKSGVYESTNSGQIYIYSGSVTLNNGTVKGAGGTAYGVVNVRRFNSSFTMNGGAVECTGTMTKDVLDTTKGYAIVGLGTKKSNPNQVTINGGKVTSVGDAIYTKENAVRYTIGGKAQVGRITIVATSSGYPTHLAFTGSALIDGLTVTGKNLGSFTAENTVRFKTDVSDALVTTSYGCFAAEDGTYKVDQLTEENAVAAVIDNDDNSTYYGTLVGAAKAVGARETVKLLKDCTSAYPVKVNNAAYGMTLDLNGHNITNTDTQSAAKALDLGFGGQDEYPTVSIINSSDTTATISAVTPVVATASQGAMAVDIGKNVTLNSTVDQRQMKLEGSAYVDVSGKTDAEVDALGDWWKTADNKLFGDFSYAAKFSTGDVTLVKDYTGSSGLTASNTCVVDFNGHTYNVQSNAESVLDILVDGVSVTLKNGTLTSSTEHTGIITNGENSDINLTLQDFTLSVPNGRGIYFPSSGSVTIENSVINAKHFGVQVCAGSLTVSGDKTAITATGTPQAKIENDGPIDDGAAVSIVNRAGYKELGKVQILGGAFAASNASKAVKAYSFNNTNKAEDAWNNAADTVSITGGYFTTDPSAYVASGYVAGTSDVSGYSYKVVEKTNTGSVEVKPAVAAPEVKVDKIPQADKEKVAEAAKTVSAPTLGAAAVDEAQKIDKTKADELVAKANEVTGNTENKKLYVQSALKVEPTAYDAANKTLALEITPQYRVVASTATTADKIKLDGDTNTKNAQVVQDYQNMTIDTPTEVTMELPTGFAVADGDKLSIQHTKNGTVEYYTGTVTKKDNKLYLTFTTNGFSPFVISVPEAAIESKVYPTLQAAVDSAKNDDIIDLYKDVAADTKVTVAKTIKFKIATNSKKFYAAKNIVAGSNTTVKVTGESSPYTYEFTYTKPSSGSSGGSSSGKTTYKVTTSAVNNGGANASPSSAEKGAAITITLSPDKGYKLDKLTVTDGSGKTVSTVKKSDTVYTFTMPASAVNVGVSYVKANETPSETKFNDVSANDWFASAVDYVTGKGMMNGTADNTFSPKANTTRGMVVTVLYRLENQPSTSAASFTDVASGAYYANAVAWANANGIVSGYGSGKFGPNDKVTREQLAAILYRYAQYKKYDVSVGEDTNILSYGDAQSISSYAIPAIQWACGAGVVTGKSGSKLDPKGNATRAEVAAMLMRFCENVK